MQYLDFRYFARAKVSIAGFWVVANWQKEILPPLLWIVMIGHRKTNEPELPLCKQHAF